MVKSIIIGCLLLIFPFISQAQTSSKVLMQMIEEGEKVPFDVAQTRTIYYNLKDIDSVANARDALADHLAAALGGGPFASPISVAVDLERLTKSDNPWEKSHAEIHGQLQELKR